MLWSPVTFVAIPTSRSFSEGRLCFSPALSPRLDGFVSGVPPDRRLCPGTMASSAERGSLLSSRPLPETDDVSTETVFPLTKILVMECSCRDSRLMPV